MLKPGQALSSKVTKCHLETMWLTDGTDGAAPTSKLSLTGIDRVFCPVKIKDQSSESQFQRDVVSHAWAETLPGATKEHLLGFTHCHLLTLV